MVDKCLYIKNCNSGAKWPSRITNESLTRTIIILSVHVGVTKGGKRRIVGDVEYDVASAKASYITPVPCGVGPMTVGGYKSP